MTFEDLATVNLNWNYETVLRIVSIDGDNETVEYVVVPNAMIQFKDYKVIWLKEGSIVLLKE